MEKTSTLDNNKKVLQMIRLLRSNGLMKAADIAKELKLKNTRSISNYKKYIELMGIPIKSIGGNQGGYIIESPIHLTKSEIRLLSLSDIPTELIDKIIKLNNTI